MLMKVIRNEREYDVALERLSTLMSAVPGTREFGELEVLGLLVDKYEAEHHAIELSSDDRLRRILGRRDRRLLQGRTR